MFKKRRKHVLNVRKKERRKVFRTIVQTVILLAVIWSLTINLMQQHVYEEPNRTNWKNTDGFIALSYFGVGRTGTAKLVEHRLLSEHLQTLHAQGFETISQEDIVRFYHEGKPLPDRALFLAFEDGRNDSALYAQSILERLNYKATFLSYADKMGSRERKFLQPKDMLKMMESGFWELGSNGYRLTYINVFDHEGRYIGVRDDSELKKMDLSSIAYYNHYLMDFIRDEHMIPMENRDEMWARISEDYALMEQVYTETLGFVPRLYMIMHANAIYSGMNPLVEEVNVANIKRLFDIHFNREGSSYNTSEEDIHNLTRLQIAPYWSTNHLLMKIQHDTGFPVQFIRGDEERAKAWEELDEGKAQFKDERIILTSPPGKQGTLYLMHSDEYEDVTVTVDVAGNVVGKQSVYLRYDRDQQSYIRITIHDNRLIVEQKRAGDEPDLLFEEELSAIAWRMEDLAFDKASIYSYEQTSAGAEKAYESGGYPINVQHTRNLGISIQGQYLSVSVDKELLFDGYIDKTLQSGGIALGTEFSQENKKDNIYDAVFEHLLIATLDEQRGEQVVYENRLTGKDAIIQTVSKKFRSLIDWMIDTF